METLAHNVLPALMLFYIVQKYVLGATAEAAMLPTASAVPRRFSAYANV